MSSVEDLGTRNSNKKKVKSITNGQKRLRKGFQAFWVQNWLLFWAYSVLSWFGPTVCLSLMPLSSHCYSKPVSRICTSQNRPPMASLFSVHQGHCNDNFVVVLWRAYGYCMLWLNLWLGLTWHEFHDLNRGDLDVFVSWFVYIWLKKLFEIVMAWLFFILSQS